MLAECTSAYAAIVGLLSEFLSGREVSKEAEADEFIRWLVERNHQELAEKIQNSHATSVFVKAFLNKEIPEIQLKLDSILALVQVLMEKQAGTVEVTIGSPLNHHYCKRIITFLFERFKSEKFSIDNFDYALDVTIDAIQGHLEGHNVYVLKAMVRECLSSSVSATDVVHKHWFNLVQ